jgi:hypothetical protein
MKDSELDDLIRELKKDISDSMDKKSFNEDIGDLPLSKNDRKVVREGYNINDTTLPTKFNIVWAENKETLLLSLLSSIIVIIIGLFSGYDYITIGGFFVFVLFSILIFFTFFRYVMVASSKSKIPDELLRKINLLEKKIEFLPKKDFKVSDDRIVRMEEELNEIKLIVKTLVDSIKKHNEH